MVDIVQLPVTSWNIIFIICLFLCVLDLNSVDGLPTTNNLATGDWDTYGSSKERHRLNVEEAKYLKRRQKITKRWGFDVDVSILH